MKKGISKKKSAPKVKGLIKKKDINNLNPQNLQSNLTTEYVEVEQNLFLNHPTALALNSPINSSSPQVELKRSASRLNIFFIVLECPHESNEAKELESYLVEKSKTHNFKFLPEGFHVLGNTPPSSSGDVIQLENLLLWWISGQILKYGWEKQKSNPDVNTLNQLELYVRKGYGIHKKNLPIEVQSLEFENWYHSSLELFLKEPYSDEGVKFKNRVVLEARNKEFATQLKSVIDDKNLPLIALWGKAHFRQKYCKPLNILTQELYPEAEVHSVEFNGVHNKISSLERFIPILNNLSEHRQSLKSPLCK